MHAEDAVTAPDASADPDASAAPAASAAADASADPAGFDSRVRDFVAAIPPGCALSYGAVAAAIGSRSARGVGRVMAFSEGLPWWRVVRASGHPAPGLAARALTHYREEGTPLRWSRDGAVYRVDLPAAAPPIRVV